MFKNKLFISITLLILAIHTNNTPMLKRLISKASKQTIFSQIYFSTKQMYIPTTPIDTDFHAEKEKPINNLEKLLFICCECHKKRAGHEGSNFCPECWQNKYNNMWLFFNDDNL